MGLLLFGYSYRLGCKMVELVDLWEDYDTFQYIATSDVEAQVKYINDTIDSFRG